MVSAFLTTLLLLGVLDGLWLGVVARELYRRHLKSLRAPRTNWIVAIAFYLLYAFGVTYFAVNPAIEADRPASGLLRGALLGLVAYGAYDLTNLATLKGWSPELTVADLLWGTVMTALVGFGAAYLVARVFG